MPPVQDHPTEYPPIGAYAVIGDCRTAALVSRDGSVDWLCMPHFSGRSVFAAILDHRSGGRFSICPTHAFRSRRRYISDTNVLQTEFVTQRGVVRVTDCLIIPFDSEHDGALQPQRELLRVVEGIEGEVQLQVRYEPRPGYARMRPRLVRRGRLGWACQAGAEILMLHADLDMGAESRGTALAGRTFVRAGQRHHLSMTYAQRDVGVIAPLGDEARRRQQWTIDWWRAWSRRCRYEGPYRDMVIRSALTLKLLTYGLSGAVIAAPTSSLPETIGGVRNWDYRYCWLRDAALTLRSFIDLGFCAEGEAFLGWLLHATRLTWPRLQILYDVYGETRLPERELEHLEGHRGSRPVRTGNAAADQLQLDVYGEVVLAAAHYVAGGGGLDPQEARLLAGFGRVVCKDWRLVDHGIWEFRDAGCHHTYSKLMCWAALDRLIALHERGHIRAPVARFRRERQAIHEAIETRGFSREIGSYVSVFDGTEIDASLLLMAQYGYKPAGDPRMRATFERIDRELGHAGFVYRYRDGYDDFLPPGEGAFVISSFWAADYLARLGDIAGARRRFENLLAHANDVGLYAEEIDPGTGEALGNFPQAFSHVGLICAAMALAKLEQPPAVVPAGVESA